MTAVDLTKKQHGKARTLLATLRAGRDPKPAVDTSEPMLPEWLRTRGAIVATTRVTVHRARYRTTRFVLHLPVLLALLVAWSPRGLARLVGVVARYLYDHDSAQVRHTHAANTETGDYVRVQNVRRANLHARWLVAGTVGFTVLVPVLAWTFPRVLAVLAGLAAFVWIVKLIPGRGLGEVAAGAGVGAAVWYFTPTLLRYVPPPPTWAVLGALVAAVLTLGWVGRPAGRAVIARPDPLDAGIVEKPTAPMVIDALCRINLTGMTEKTRDEVRVMAPGVARSRRGYHLALELPAGVTAAGVMDKREEFAGALRRELGTVWPSKGLRHPGHLELFISDLPMATAPQETWPLAKGAVVDIFDALALFTDQEGKWVDLTLAYNHVVIGGAPGYGKSFAVRQLGVAVAFDPRVRITTMDGKGNGDLRPLRAVAHGFYEGDEPDEIAEQLVALRAIREEMRRRARFLRDLPREENPLSKVTSQLVNRYPHLAPIVVLVDEVQVYAEHEDKAIRAEFVAIFTDLVKRGRSAGIIPVFCTQKPDAKALPTSIASNCSVRLCFRVNDWQANDQVLGTSAHQAGLKATLFSSQDKGLAYLKGDGRDPLVVRTVHGLDAVAAEELMVKARAIREARGLLTGQAAGEIPDPVIEPVFLDDVRDVLDHPTVPTMHLAELRDALALLRPTTWGHLDNAALGSLLRAAGVRVGTVWSRASKSDGKGVRREWLDAATTDGDPDEGGSKTVVTLTR